MFNSVRVIVPFLAMLFSLSALANDAPPTDESIAEMLRLGHVEDNFYSLKPQVDAVMRKSLDEAMGGNTLNDAQRAAYERGRERMATAISAHFNWEAMREIYLRVYQTAFTQDELDGIVAFYRTPAGAALVAKMPLLQQTLLQEIQTWMRPVVHELKVIGVDMRKEMDEAATVSK